MGRHGRKYLFNRNGNGARLNDKLKELCLISDKIKEYMVSLEAELNKLNLSLDYPLQISDIACKLECICSGVGVLERKISSLDKDIADIETYNIAPLFMVKAKHIHRALEKCNWNRTEAAKMLDISVRDVRLWCKMLPEYGFSVDNHEYLDRRKG